MRAITIEQSGGESRYAVADVPEPVMSPDDLLVEVHAAAINQADLRHAPSHFSTSEGTPLAPVGGLEMAGRIIALGQNVAGFAIGDRVMAMTGRAWADRATVDYRLAIPVPASFSWVEAASTPVSYVTAHDCLVSAAHLEPGETVLVQGATSAVGIAAVQIAKYLGASIVFGTTSKQDKADGLAGLGCDVPIVHGVSNVVDVVNEATNNVGVDVVVDVLGATVVQENVDAARVSGRIICVGRLSGTEGHFNLNEFSRKRIHMVGVTFRTRTMQERFDVTARFRREMLAPLEDHQVRPLWDRCFSLDDVAEAEEYLKEGTQFGKVLLMLMDDD